MLEQFFKSQVAAVSDPYQCSRITDALAAAGIKFYCKTKDVNRRNTFDQAILPHTHLQMHLPCYMVILPHLCYTLLFLS